jgi:hypothetical protein
MERVALYKRVIGLDVHQAQIARRGNEMGTLLVGQFRLFSGARQIVQSRIDPSLNARLSRRVNHALRHPNASTISGSLPPAAIFNKTLARVINRAERFPLLTRPPNTPLHLSSNSPRTVLYPSSHPIIK